MRLNKALALATGLSRRAADDAIAGGRVLVNGLPAQLGQRIKATDTITLDSKIVALKDASEAVTIMLNKPAGYVVSRNGQGSKTVYDLLPPEYRHLKPVGRLDKDSSGLLLLTNDGQLAYELTHPSKQKTKVYYVTLDKPLQPKDKALIETGVMLEDGVSKLEIETVSGHSQPLDPYASSPASTYAVRMHEGRNRQIRRTFAALGYKVAHLHRTQFGPHKLPPELQPMMYRPLAKKRT